MIISKTYCKCPQCGSECEVDTSMVLTSYPPKYQAFCKKCNKMVYIFCSDVYGKAPINPENNTIEKDADYHNDIHRIADALERITKLLESEKTGPIINPISISPSITPNTWPSCESCWYYQLKNNNKIEFGDSPCNRCPKMQVTCTANSEIK